MKKVLNAICTAAIIAGVVLAFGAAGASDCGAYTTTQALTQVSIATVLLFGGLTVKAFIN